MLTLVCAHWATGRWAALKRWWRRRSIDPRARYRASSLRATHDDGDTVDRLADESDNGRDLVAAGRPTYQDEMIALKRHEALRMELSSTWPGPEPRTVYRVPCACGWQGLWSDSATGAELATMTHIREAEWYA